MEGVSAHSRPEHFGVYVGTSFLRELKFLKNQHSSSLGKNKPVTPRLKRPRRGLRLVVSGRKRPHGVKSRKGKGYKRSFRSAGYHNVRLAVPYNLGGKREGVTACRTRGRRRTVGTLGVELYRDVSRGHVGHYVRYEKGRDAAGTLVLHGQNSVVEGTHPADARPDKSPRACGDVIGNLKPGILKRELGGRNGELNEPVVSLRVLGFHVKRRIKVLHFPRNLGFKIRRVKSRNPAHSGNPFADRRPRGVVSHPDGRYEPYACNHYPSCHLSSVILRSGFN